MYHWKRTTSSIMDHTLETHLNKFVAPLWVFIFFVVMVLRITRSITLSGTMVNGKLYSHSKQANDSNILSLSLELVPVWKFYIIHHQRLPYELHINLIHKCMGVIVIAILTFLIQCQSTLFIHLFYKWYVHYVED